MYNIEENINIIACLYQSIIICKNCNKTMDYLTYTNYDNNNKARYNVPSGQYLNKESKIHNKPICSSNFMNGGSNPLVSIIRTKLIFKKLKTSKYTNNKELYKIFILNLQGNSYL